MVSLKKVYNNYNEYVGDSEDDKPTEAPVNSTFLELDTNDSYYFDGASWTKIGSVDGQTK